MEIDEHLKYTLYVPHQSERRLNVSATSLTLLQPAIRTVPARRRAHGLSPYARLLFVIRDERAGRSCTVLLSVVARSAPRVAAR